MWLRLKIVHVFVPVLTGGVFVSDKCPMCDSTTTEVVDPDSGDLKVSCEACGYENIEVGESQNNDRLVDPSNMSDSDLLRKIDQDISTVSSRVDRICVVGGLVIGYWIVSWILALLDVWNS